MESGVRIQPSFFERQLRPLQRRWRGKRLSAAILRLAQLEHDLKTGMIPGESSADVEFTALQVFLADLGVIAASP
jgi:hypothetical protein